MAGDADTSSQTLVADRAPPLAPRVSLALAMRQAFAPFGEFGVPSAPEPMASGPAPRPAPAPDASPPSAAPEPMVRESALYAIRTSLAATQRALSALHADFARITDQTLNNEASLARLVGEIEGFRGAVSGRLDELEVKTRPLIAFDDESYAVRLMDGYAMVPRDNPTFVTMVADARSGGLEAGTRAVLKALIQPGMAVADVGANVGLLTLACATATGPTGVVYAFEPEAGPRAQLEKTLRYNGLSWVRVFDRAVSAASGTTVFHVSPILGHSSLYALPDEEAAGVRDVEVRTVTLDEVVGPGGRLDVVKIDVEGAELDVIAGMPRILAENPDIALICEYGPSHLERVGISPDQWFAAFEGFAMYAIEEPFGACRPVTPEDLADAYSVNLAFVRPGGPASSRLKIA
jgi:FkbM family methyltransferase